MKRAQYRERKRLEKVRAGLGLDGNENDADVTDPVTIRNADKIRRDGEKKGEENRRRPFSQQSTTH